MNKTQLNRHKNKLVKQRMTNAYNLVKTLYLKETGRARMPKPYDDFDRWLAEKLAEVE